MRASPTVSSSSLAPHTRAAVRGMVTAACVTAAVALAQSPAVQSTPPGLNAGPIAIVPLNESKSGAGATVTGALQVTAGKAIIAASGAVTSGSTTTDVLLPQRGTLHVCASTTVKLAADSSAPAGETPGLMMAMDHGAIEASLATGRSADILLTPDFRVLISGPGAADVKVRLGEHGDTCVDNGGSNAPYVLVTSVFDGGNYHVQPGQRVMFQHGSVHEVVDQEKEPCGCPPPPAQAKGNEFPLAQSEGLAPTPQPKPSPAHKETASIPPPPLVYNAAAHTPPEPTQAGPASPAVAPSTSAQAVAAPPKKPGFFHRLGHFFRHIF
ncbi:MAG: hypothetical protein WCA37_03850 [Terracidiphilus sp.]